MLTGLSEMSWQKRLMMRRAKQEEIVRRFSLFMRARRRASAAVLTADDFVTPEPITSSPSACASVPNVHKLLSPACGDETLLDTAPPPTAWKTTSLTTNTNFDKLQPLACGDKTLPTCVPHAKSYIANRQCT
jgi:hypothetical protein